jgi:hypothetical protein
MIAAINGSSDRVSVSYTRHQIGVGMRNPLRLR